MGWRLKSAQFKFLSLLPGGQGLYRHIQEHVTRTTAANRPRVEQKIGVGLQYWDWLKAHGHAEKFRNGTLLDFGAGWHPTIPLVFYSLGNNHQVLADLAALMDPGKVTDTIRLFRQITDAPGWGRRGELRRLPELPEAGARTTAEILRAFGMEYTAPYAPSLSQRPNAFDAIFSTEALYYIPQKVQPTIYRQLHACLKPGGLFLAQVHLVGQFRDPNQRKGQYDHLRYSPAVWDGIINSSLMSHDRLKAPDYREMLQKTGFEILDFQVDPPTPEDLADLKRAPVHSFFRRYSLEDLGARHLFFVAQKV